MLDLKLGDGGLSSRTFKKIRQVDVSLSYKCDGVVILSVR